MSKRLIANLNHMDVIMYSTTVGFEWTFKHGKSFILSHLAFEKHPSKNLGEPTHSLLDA